MPRPTPFHERTASLCESQRWKDWAGYFAVCSYGNYVEREYFALRHAAGLVDVTPLYKYDVRGADAAAFLSSVMVRDITRLKLGQIYYCCWCDDAGKIVDDGTVWWLDEGHYRVTSTEPAFAWLSRFAGGYDVQITDVSDAIATLSVQGPAARDVLRDVCDADLDTLRFFWLTRARFDGFEAVVTRTGYTGDLGYEVWVRNADALRLYDAVLDAGRAYGAMPAGLDAQDMCRIEAGFVLNGVEYTPAPRCLIESRTSTPYELGFDWMVRLEREPFNGQRALMAEHKAGPRKRLACLELDWDAYERLYAEHDLPPEVCPEPWRTDVPVYDLFGRYIGYATSGVWSPLCKKNLALAHLPPEFTDPRTEVKLEVTVEHQRRKCLARVGPKPALTLRRTRSLPEKESADGADNADSRRRA